MQALQKLFTMHDLLDTLIMVNVTAFTLVEFQEFTMRYRIQYDLLAPFHPKTNSQAEHMVHTTKNSLRKVVQGDWHFTLVRFLLLQHMMPCTSTGCSLAELLMGCKLNTFQDTLYPDRAPEQQPSPDTKEEPRGFFPRIPVYRATEAVLHGSWQE